MSAATSSRRARLALGAALLGLGLLTALLALHNQRSVGVARDEVVYRAHGVRYAAWWGALLSGNAAPTARSITATFGGPGATDNNREHPPLLKTASGASELLLAGRLGLTDGLTAARVPAAILHGLLIALVGAFAARAWGAAAGVLSALAMLLLPRALFHASLACFDGPITALWFATLWAYARVLRRGRGLGLACVTFGLALATKHNALMLPVVMTAHHLLWARGKGLWQRGRSWRARLLPLWISAGGALFAVALWPWLWLAPFEHAAQWISFHTHHVHYNYEYLGTNWNAPPFPWHVPLVTTALTVPVATLAAAIVGGVTMVLGWRASPKGEPAGARPGLLLMLSAAVATGPFFLGIAPIFGAEKHWQPALPSLCIAAGVGIAAASRALARLVAARWHWPTTRVGHCCTAFVAAAVLGSAAVETFHPQPYGLTAYNALAGGAPGAADLGMNRQFWGVAARGVLPALAGLAPPGDAPVPIYTHDASPAWGTYRALRLVSPRFVDAGPEASGIDASELAMVIHERHFARHDFMIWQAYGTVAPVYVLTLDGVPLVSVYKRPRRP